ncbi:MAG: cytidine deaminase [Gemmatimonadaceae bacterium]|nr:cytidine deaminase [Gemmatimonadaceae bacterium]
MSTAASTREQELTARARQAQARAYAPYSKFTVGAALLCADGSIVEGCNVENASYPAGTCAERVALGAAVVAGQREFAAIAIATDASVATPPCGICRQALAEFQPALPVVAIDREGRVTRWTLAELLPTPFTPSSLHS